MQDELSVSCNAGHSDSECPDKLIVRTSSGFGLSIKDGGSSYIEIAFCPFCGAFCGKTDAKSMHGPAILRHPKPSISHLKELASEYDYIAETTIGNASWSYAQMALHVRERIACETTSRRQLMLIAMLIYWLVISLFVR